MGYGINRIPQDTDPTSEAMAQIQAQEMQPKPTRQLKRCENCGCMTSQLMSSSNGDVCPDCYDECSDW